MRIALIIGLAPRKQGSLEDWLAGIAREASRRSHQLDIFGLEPILPDLQATLEEHGATWNRVVDLSERPLRAIRRLRSYDVVHLNFFGVGSRIALLSFGAWPTPIVYVDHFSKRELRMSPVARLRRSVLTRIARSRIAVAVGVSDFIRKHVVSLLGLRSDRAVTVYNGIDLDRFAFEPNIRDRDGALRVLAVANLIPEKGVDRLLEAASRVDSVHLKVIGEGPERRHLEELASSLGIAGRTEFLGLRSDVEQHLAECDVFVHPAIWTEAFGLTVAEAMAGARPVVASRIGALPELIEHGRSGLLVPPGDDSALAAALQQLLESSSLRRDLGTNARRRATDLFDLDRCVERHVDLCEEAANHGDPGVAAPGRGEIEADS
jgi:glycosyltransferase involved in cell wall biosynthesis